MTSLVDLCRAHSSLDRSDIDHLHRLTAEWAFLADLCFSDLLLHVRSDDGRWMIVDQVRPATNQTMYPIDFVGIWASQAEDLMNKAADSGEIVEGDITLNVPVAGTDETVARAVAIPVRHDGEVIAVLTKEWMVRAGRSLGELERGYSDIFDQFTHMIALRHVPVSRTRGRLERGTASRRRRDDARRRRSRSPTCRRTRTPHCTGSGSRRIRSGCAWPSSDSTTVRRARRSSDANRSSRSSSRVPSVTLLARCVPLCAAPATPPKSVGGSCSSVTSPSCASATGCCCRKDATIREIHHRVKNNLQTISSLLRLQARRLESDEANAAVAESVRRIRTIALVHESLSREPGDDIDVHRDRPAAAPPRRGGTAVPRSSRALLGVGLRRPDPGA